MGRAQPSGGILPNGLLPNVVPRVTRVLDSERWSEAEERTAELISCIQPNPPSEERRSAVANFVQRLVTNCISCQVFQFGSVPLKTYLPDGDIDLTACSTNESLKDSWANSVRDVLEKEEKSPNAEFCVKEVQYIQAEVKLIKCLVENIVVDISFNQVGGLCTLCFLEEMDKLINHNHLFKRSIILIKAWCYYESRILGAHHGLISTYALETLVLYIFHVFNNSFVGPLEVLYRFLEFFSNFDWDNFCVSLWGPVPINSLPDMTAEPPRKDNGKLLLSKGYLDGRSQMYAVIPGGQESHVQPFISKHFNVVDPLRTNNNLGRSVSKGNFFRIRSAFAFGAKRLAWLLECPKEVVTAEVNKFFMNTWGRHGSGNRPDVPNLDFWDSQPSKPIPVEVNNQKITTVVKKNGDSGPSSGREQVDSFESSTSIVNRNNQNSHSVNMSSNPSTFLRTQNQKAHRTQANLRVPEHIEGSNCSSGRVQGDKSQKTPKHIYFVNDWEGQGRFQFARVRSSPELTEPSVDSSRGRRARAEESSLVQFPDARPDYGRRKISSSEIAGNHSSWSLDDSMPMQQTLLQNSADVNHDSQSASNGYHGDAGFGMLGKELASVSEALELQQEEQDMVNMMDIDMHRFQGPVQVPLHLASHHVPFKFSPMTASVGFSHRNLAGVFPSNVSLLGPSWGQTMQGHLDLVSSPLSHYYPITKLSENHNGGSVNGIPGTTDLNTDDADHRIWYEHHTTSSSDLNSIDSRTQMLHLDGKLAKSQGIGNFFSAQSFCSLASTESPNRIREDRSLAGEDGVDVFHNQASKSDDSFRANQRSSLIPQVGSKSKPAPENLKEGYTVKYTKPGTEISWGSKPSSSSSLDPSNDKTNNDFLFESSSNNFSSEAEDELADWNTLSAIRTELPERILGPGSVAFQDAGAGIQPISGYVPATQRNGTEPVIPFRMLMGAPQHSGTDSSKVLPVAFVPTGPPVPFYIWPITMQSNMGNPDGSENQLYQEDSDNLGLGNLDRKVDLKKSINEPDVLLNFNTLSGTVPESSHSKSDILNSDYTSHLQNLAYGRSCQNLQYQGELIYPSPVVVPPIYLQGHQPWDGPGRPITPNFNFAHMMGYGSGLVPLVPYQQPGPDGTTSGFQRFRDDAPRYRGGTGTYLPIPKASFRDRQSSSRNHRGNYNYDRNNYGDKEGSWNNSKQRANRSHGRNQGEKANSRPDRLFAADNHTERIQEHRHETVSSYPSHNNSTGSTNLHRVLPNMIGVYPQTSLSSNDTDRPVMVVYPIDQSLGYASPSGTLEFGSRGPVPLYNGKEASSRLNDAVPARRLYEQKRHNTYQGISPQSSCDDESS